jgi:hypothetical protein
MAQRPCDRLLWPGSDVANPHSLYREHRGDTRLRNFSPQFLQKSPGGNRSQVQTLEFRGIVARRIFLNRYQSGRICLTFHVKQIRLSGTLLWLSLPLRSLFSPNKSSHATVPTCLAFGKAAGLLHRESTNSAVVCQTACHAIRSRLPSRFMSVPRSSRWRLPCTPDLPPQSLHDRESGISLPIRAATIRTSLGAASPTVIGHLSGGKPVPTRTFAGSCR